MRKIHVASVLCLLLSAGSFVYAADNSFDSFAKAMQGEQRFDAGTFYNPPLPVPRYLDAQQAKLASALHPKVEDFFYFPDENDPAHPEIAATGMKLKRWTPEEKADVHRIAQRILQIVPGLAVRAACGRKIALCRIDTIVSGPKLAEMTRGKPFAAATCPCAIVISDRFFDTPYQFHGLTHELTHEADLTLRVAFSKEWIDFIERPIAEARLKMALSPSYKSKEIAAVLLRQNICPTAYSCTNLEESLAELTSSYIDQGDFRPSQLFINRFAQRLFQPNAKELQNDLRIKLARISYRNKDTKVAIPMLQNAVQSEPALLAPLIDLAYCYGLRSDKTIALGYAKKADAVIRQVRLPWTDERRTWIVQALLYGLTTSNQFDKSMLLIKEQLSNLPYDPLGSYERFYIEQGHRLYTAAVSDLYHACYPTDDVRLLRDAAVNPELAQTFVDREVLLNPNMGVSRVRRASLEQWQGDRESNVTKQSLFYKNALSDYEKAKDDEVCGKQALFEACSLNLKLGNNAEAVSCYKKAQEKAPDSEEVALMGVQIAASAGHVDEAQEKLGQFRSRNEAKLDKLINAALGKPPE